ncbi:helix-turn-helix transcriptional regulator [Vibrio sp. SCSIO 43136]|uniref:helix-turn-helix transcriptional regulator n=1 Tax=Vibrio sp. SCSIO 43136 TaxID=2819101 RepID=UPI002074C03A|nr:helix-turn-helix transcriptional regulator [Vibrio sp. SCSIO 43136]USD64189.1 helix-turn-helix transcriptional regulator [Vibrio sp. SCSIO 43136]
MKQDDVINVIKDRRNRANLTQKELANLSGMDRKTYQRIESGKVDLRFSQYRGIINALGVSDLDITLDRIGITGASDLDVAAAARLLSPTSRLKLVEFIIEEYRARDD